MNAEELREKTCQTLQEVAVLREQLKKQERDAHRRQNALDGLAVMQANPGWTLLELTSGLNPEYDGNGGYFLDYSLSVRLESLPQDIHYAHANWLGDQVVPENPLTACDSESDSADVEEAFRMFWAEESQMSTAMRKCHPDVAEDIVWCIRRTDVEALSFPLTEDTLDGFFDGMVQRT